MRREKCSLVVKVEEPLSSSSWAILFIRSFGDCSTLCVCVYISMCVSLVIYSTSDIMPQKLGDEAAGVPVPQSC